MPLSKTTKANKVDGDKLNYHKWRQHGMASEDDTTSDDDTSSSEDKIRIKVTVSGLYFNENSSEDDKKSRASYNKGKSLLMDANVGRKISKDSKQHVSYTRGPSASGIQGPIIRVTQDTKPQSMSKCPNSRQPASYPAKSVSGNQGGSSNATFTKAHTPKSYPKPQPKSQPASKPVSGTQSQPDEVPDKIGLCLFDDWINSNDEKPQYLSKDSIPSSTSCSSNSASKSQRSVKVTDSKQQSSRKRLIPQRPASYPATLAFKNRGPTFEDPDLIGLSLMDDWNDFKNEKQQISNKNPNPWSSSYPSKSVSRAQGHPIDEDGDTIGLSVMDNWNNLNDEKQQYLSKTPTPPPTLYSSKSVSRIQGHPSDEVEDLIGLSVMDDWNKLNDEKEHYSSKTQIPASTPYPSKSVSRIQSHLIDEGRDQVGVYVMDDANNYNDKRQQYSTKNPIPPTSYQSKPVSGIQGHPIEVRGKLKGVKVLKEEGIANRISNPSFLGELERNTPKRFLPEELKKLTSDFSDRVGLGGFGSVYRGNLLNGTEIVVKVLKENDFVEESFEAEVSTMFKTSHRYLVKCYGYCFDPTMKALVYEYMENGSLDSFMYGNPRNLEWKKFYEIAIKTAKGLSYLHDGCDNQIIHHDLKPANVLIGKNLCVKITDFGMARIMNPDVDFVSWSQLRGTPGFVAPEMSMPGSRITYKCDVYSFGMMLFEVLRMRSNGWGLDWFPNQVWSNFENGELDQIIEECGIHKEKYRIRAKVLSIVALWCVQFTPQARPPMSTVVKMLEGEIQVTEPPNPFYPAPDWSYSKFPHSPSLDKKLP